MEVQCLALFKKLMRRTNPADDRNLCSWAMRSMLVDYGERKVLIDNGIGDKQSDKFFSHYHLHGDTCLISSLALNGYHPDDITDVFLIYILIIVEVVLSIMKKVNW